MPPTAHRRQTDHAQEGKAGDGGQPQPEPVGSKGHQDRAGNSRKRGGRLRSLEGEEGRSPAFPVDTRDPFNLDPCEDEAKRPRRLASLRPRGGETLVVDADAEEWESGAHDASRSSEDTDDEVLSVGSQSPVSISSRTAASASSETEEFMTVASGEEEDADARYARLLQQQEFALALHAYHAEDGLGSEVEAAILGGGGDGRLPAEILHSSTLDMSYEGLLQLEENLGEVKRRGLDAIALRAFPRLRFGELGHAEASRRRDRTGDEDAICSICMTEYESEDLLMRMLTCSHLFHEECAVNWLGVRATCPICREAVMAREGEETTTIL